MIIPAAAVIAAKVFDHFVGRRHRKASWNCAIETEIRAAEEHPRVSYAVHSQHYRRGRGEPGRIRRQGRNTSNNAAVRVHRAREALRKQATLACGICATHPCVLGFASANPSPAQIRSREFQDQLVERTEDSNAKQVQSLGAFHSNDQAWTGTMSM
jgi:hypothetical protein